MKEKYILDELNGSGAAQRVAGIRDSIKSNMRTAAIKEKLISLQSDNIELIGWTVGDYATIALDILDMKKYTGTNENIRAGIKNLKSLRDTD